MTTGYDAYGNVSALSAGVHTPLGFAGQYTDAETGFVYLRNRYYDPATGQFLTQDPLVAVTGSAYGYAGNNPLNNIDPSGMSWLSDRASDVGGFVVEHRHTIIDVATTLGASTVTGACIASVACGVAVGAVGVAAVGIAGVESERMSPPTVRSETTIRSLSASRSSGLGSRQRPVSHAVCCSRRAASVPRPPSRGGNSSPAASPTSGSRGLYPGLLLTGLGSAQAGLARCVVPGLLMIDVDGFVKAGRPKVVLVGSACGVRLRPLSGES